MIRSISVGIAIALLFFSSCNNGSQSTSASDSTSTSKDSSNTVARSTSSSGLELVYKDSTYQLTGIGKADGGNLFVNYPRWSGPYRYAVVQSMGDSAKPYPNDTMNKWAPGQPGRDKWVCVQSVYFDDNGTLWVLDPAAPQLKKIQGGGAKLVRMNKETGKPERTYMFNNIISDTSYVNDVRIDVQKQYAYITDSKTGGIVITDLNSGKMREVLKAHKSTISDPAFKFIIDGHELMKDGKPAKFNSDGIALTPDGAWLYYKPLSDDKLYRIKTDYLRDWNMSDTALQSKVEDLGHFTTTDGMIFDKEGNLYLGDLQNYRIVRLDKNLKMTELVKDQRLIWPDSYAIADGYLYISCSQIQKQPDYNNGKNLRNSPYTVYRLKL